jgi:putative ABC transport system permease protein
LVLLSASRVQLADDTEQLLEQHGALGAARRHVAAQFLIESLVLATAGGTAGVLLGVAITYGLARLRHWQPLVLSTAVGAALAAALVIGAVAGSYPASRAARLSPTEALRTAK